MPVISKERCFNRFSNWKSPYTSQYFTCCCSCCCCWLSRIKGLLCVLFYTFSMTIKNDHNFKIHTHTKSKFNKLHLNRISVNQRTSFEVQLIFYFFSKTKNKNRAMIQITWIIWYKLQWRYKWINLLPFNSSFTLNNISFPLTLSFLPNFLLAPSYPVAIIIILFHFISRSWFYFLISKHSLVQKIKFKNLIS